MDARLRVAEASMRAAERARALDKIEFERRVAQVEQRAQTAEARAQAAEARAQAAETRARAAEAALIKRTRRGSIGSPPSG